MTIYRTYVATKGQLFAMLDEMPDDTPLATLFSGSVHEHRNPVVYVQKVTAVYRSDGSLSKYITGGDLDAIVFL